MKGTPRTRQSPLTLAAFRPWGSSQDGRRAGSVGECSAPAGGRGHPAMLAELEDSPSGLWRTLGKRVGFTPSGVRIPHPPPA